MCVLPLEWSIYEAPFEEKALAIDEGLLGSFGIRCERTSPGLLVAQNHRI